MTLQQHRGSACGSFRLQVRRFKVPSLVGHAGVAGIAWFRRSSLPIRRRAVVMSGAENPTVREGCWLLGCRIHP